MNLGRMFRALALVVGMAATLIVPAGLGLSSAVAAEGDACAIGGQPGVQNGTGTCVPVTTPSPGLSCGPGLAFDGTQCTTTCTTSNGIPGTGTSGSCTPNPTPAQGQQCGGSAYYTTNGGANICVPNNQSCSYSGGSGTQAGVYTNGVCGPLPTAPGNLPTPPATPGVMTPISGAGTAPSGEQQPMCVNASPFIGGGVFVVSGTVLCYTGAGRDTQIMAYNDTGTQGGWNPFNPSEWNSLSLKNLYAGNQLTALGTISGFGGAQVYSPDGKTGMQVVNGKIIMGSTNGTSAAAIELDATQIKVGVSNAGSTSSTVTTATSVVTSSTDGTKTSSVTTKADGVTIASTNGTAGSSSTTTVDGVVHASTDGTSTSASTTTATAASMATTDGTRVSVVKTDLQGVTNSSTDGTSTSASTTTATAASMATTDGTRLSVVKTDLQGVTNSSTDGTSTSASTTTATAASMATTDGTKLSVVKTDLQGVANASTDGTSTSSSVTSAGQVALTSSDGTSASEITVTGGGGISIYGAYGSASTQNTGVVISGTGRGTLPAPTSGPAAWADVLLASQNFGGSGGYGVIVNDYGISMLSPSTGVVMTDSGVIVRSATTGNTYNSFGSGADNAAGSSLTNVIGAGGAGSVSNFIGSAGQAGTQVINEMGTGSGGYTTNRIGNANALTSVVTQAGSSSTVVIQGALDFSTGQGASVLANPTQQVRGGQAVAMLGTTQTHASVDANGKVTVVHGAAAPEASSSLYIVNGQGGANGVVVTERAAVMSGGESSPTSMTLNDYGVTFSNANTGGPVIVSGIADGQGPNDAVNKRQMDGGLASVAAMTGLPAPQAGKRNTFGMAVGQHGSGTALALGGQSLLGEAFTFKYSAAVSHSSGLIDGSASMGIGYSW